MTKRQFFAASFGTGAALAQTNAAWGQQVAAAARNERAQTKGKPATRMAKTTKLFKSPQGFPNGLAVTSEGLWIAEQKLSGAQAASYKLPEPKSLAEKCWLVDWNGKVLRTVETPSRNTSGMAVGGGYVWMVANAPPQGVFQVDMNSKLISHRQIPLGPATGDGGGSHGAHWQDGKLWISSLRLRGNLRVDPKTWAPEYMIPFYQSFPDRVRYHDITIDNGSMWQVVGNDSKRYSEGKPGLVRYDLATGRAVETVDFVPGSCDPHGLVMHDGKLVGCDAGIHPGWPNNDSPTAGWIFQIDFL